MLLIQKTIIRGVICALLMIISTTLQSSERTAQTIAKSYDYFYLYADDCESCLKDVDALIERQTRSMEANSSGLRDDGRGQAKPDQQMFNIFGLKRTPFYYICFSQGLLPRRGVGVQLA